MHAAKWFLAALVLGVALAEVHDRHPSAEPSDITSINSLPAKKPRVDPKLRKALLRVLNKIKEEENGQLPADLPEEDFLKVIGEPVQSEDLGSIEINEEQGRNPNFPYEAAFQFGQRLAGGESKVQNENNQGGFDSQFNGYFVDRPTSGGNYDFPQDERGSYSYERPSSGSFGSGEVNDEGNGGKTEKNGAEEATTDVRGTLTPEGVTSALVPENSNESTLPAGEKGEEPTTEPATSEKDGKETTIQVEYNTNQEDNSSQDSDVATEPANESAFDVRVLGANNQARPLENVEQDRETVEESKIINSNHSFSSSYRSLPTTLNFLPTNPTPDEDKHFDDPKPIQAPDIDGKTGRILNHQKLVNSQKLEGNGDKDIKGNEEKKKENVRHVVEFVSAPLITAFTVQQDDNGVPQRVIPLDYVNPTKPPSTTEDPDIVAQRQRELEEKEFILQQQLRSLQKEKYRYTGEPQTNQEEFLRQQQQEGLRQQQEIIRQQQFQQQQFLPQQHFLPPNQIPLQQNLHQQPGAPLQEQINRYQTLPQQQAAIPQHPVNQQQSIQQTQYFNQRPQNQQQFQPQSQFPQQSSPSQQNFQHQFQRQSLIQQSKALDPEEFLRQQEILRYQQNYQRQQDFQRQRELHRQQELLRQQTLFRQQEQLQRQQLERQNYQQKVPFISNNGLELQKSIDFRLPLFDHNRVHRQEPNYLINNLGYNQPATISGQIQNLIYKSGISTGLPQNTKTDLSIVSKILALDYEKKSNNVKRESVDPSKEKRKIHL